MTTSTLNLNRKYTGKSVQNATKNILESGFPLPQGHTRPEEERGISRHQSYFSTAFSISFLRPQRQMVRIVFLTSEGLIRVILIYFGESFLSDKLACNHQIYVLCFICVNYFIRHNVV